MSLIFFTFEYHAVYSQLWLKNIINTGFANFYSIRYEFLNYYKDTHRNKIPGYKQFKRWEYFWERRLDKNGNFPNARKVLIEFQKYHNSIKTKDKSLTVGDWIELGPKKFNTKIHNPKLDGNGRINCIAFNPKVKNIIWVGSAGGGLWKTSDAGKNWFPVEMTNFLSLGITDIAISETEPNIMYAATGDSDGWFSSGCMSIGIIKSYDGGINWEILNPYSIDSLRILTRLLLHPQNPDILYASTNHEILKTTNGGKTWENLLSGSYFRDMEFLPSNPDIIFISTYDPAGKTSVLKSTDAGKSWLSIKEFTQISRIQISVNSIHPSHILLLCSEYTRNNFGGLFESFNEGENWSEISVKLDSLQGVAQDLVVGQGFYNLVLAVSPYQDSIVFSGGINLWKSENSFKSWENIQTGIHYDLHDIKFNPHDSMLYVATDGGISKSSDRGASWVDISAGLGITQFYKFGAAPQAAGIIFGGSQDNGTLRYRNGYWDHVVQGDMMECIIDRNDLNNVFFVASNGLIAQSSDGGDGYIPYDITPDGEDGAWITPFTQDPSNTKTFYAGFSELWRTANNGKNWEKVTNFNDGKKINVIAIAPNFHETIYLAKDTELYCRRSFSDEWKKIFTANAPITSITVSQYSPDQLWLTLGGYVPNNKVFYFDSNKWLNISGNIPNIPVNSIVFRPGGNNSIYIGTDFGVLYCDNNDSNWFPLGTGLPNVIVNELEIHNGTGKLQAATYGRGIWEIELWECRKPNIPILNISGKKEICSGSSIKLFVKDTTKDKYVWSNGKTGSVNFTTKPGIYFVTAVNTFGCMEVSVPLELEVLPEMNVKIRAAIGNLTLPEQTIYKICSNDTLKIFMEVPQNGNSSDSIYSNLRYLWSNNDTSRAISISDSGYFSLSVITPQNCTFTSQLIQIQLFPKPAKPLITQKGNLLTSSPSIGYQWYFSGEPIENANSQTFSANESGYYYVEITDENGCSGKSDSIPITVGVTDKFKDFTFEIHIRPKEEVSEIEFLSKMEESYKLEIFDIHGIQMFKNNGISSSGKNMIYFSSFSMSSGIYFLRLQIGNRIYCKKFTIIL
ncbi:MAG: glycosyl hydrolase [Ignavibacteria bacterium]|nr:glycosyl hydrolase [Ignavibacteria bacterium]